MKVSIVISVYNSHEIVRRQMLHWEREQFPDDVEILLMDDGSETPLTGSVKNLRIIPVGNPRGVSDGRFYDGRVSIARNMGARMARGKYLLMTDIDYIIRRADVEAARNCTHDKQGFRREFGVIKEDGTVTQDLDVLRKYGLSENRIAEKGVTLPPHTNNFIMRRDTFLDIGGYRENLQGAYPSRGDTWFKRDWTVYHEAGKGTISHDRTTLLMFPNGRFCGDVDYNPFGLFHGLSRVNKNNPYARKEQSNEQAESN